MHYPLPESVRLAIAGLTQNVSHATVWGEFTQMTYPGECRWVVKGGADWPMFGHEVSVLSTGGDDPIRIEGMEEMRTALSEVRATLAASDQADANLQNEETALTEVLLVLETAEYEAALAEDDRRVGDSKPTWEAAATMRSARYEQPAHD